jgi:hypothetical protein
LAAKRAVVNYFGQVGRRAIDQDLHLWVREFKL